MSNNQVQTESSNLAVVEEIELGSKILPSTGWRNLEPNSYGSFGPSYKKEPRDPISKNAQLQKGMLTDLDSGLAIETDITKDNIDRFAGGMFRCVARHAGNTNQSFYASSAAAADGFVVQSNGALAQHMLVVARGFETPTNNDLFEVGAGSGAAKIAVAGLVVESGAPANASVEVAGYRMATGDGQLDADGNLISLGAVDFTTWNLLKFSWVVLGDPNDVTHSFGNPDFIGSARVRKVETHKITFDRRAWEVSQRSYLDLASHTSHVDTVLEAQDPGSTGDTYTIALVDDGDAALKASLSLATVTAHVNTVIQAKAAGVGGNSITVEIVSGAPTTAGVLTEVGSHVKLAIKTTATATTVANLEALIGSSALIEVKTPGTGATSLDGTDVAASTALAGGAVAEAPTLVETSTATTIHFTGGATTVAQLEALIASDSTLLQVKAPGTASHVLVHTTDELTATAFAHGGSGSDTAAGKRIDVYFGRYYRNVATDHPDYRTPSYAFEVEYPTLDDGSPEYEYLMGNMVDECTWNIPLTTKATMSLKFVGTKTLNPTATRKAGPVNALNPNTNAGVSTATDLLRLRVVDHDEVGISTDFTNLKITQQNGISPEKELGVLGAKFMNIGKHKEMVEATCIFTNDLVIKAVRDNRTTSLDCLMRNDDFGAMYDLHSMTLDGADRKLERDKSVTIDSKATGFQDLISGSTAGLTVFPYLPAVDATED